MNEHINTLQFFKILLKFQLQYAWGFESQPQAMSIFYLPRILQEESCLP